MLSVCNLTFPLPNMPSYIVMMMLDTAAASARHTPAADDLLELREDDEGRGPGPARSWVVLIVDDDRDVHEATAFALRNARVLGRPLRLLHASSATEAARTVAERRDIALILLDVVMETEDAGLKLVGVIREQLGRRDVRILIRTGQPGYCPEVEVIRDYPVDGYLLKSQTTGGELQAAIAGALGG